MKKKMVTMLAAMSAAMIALQSAGLSAAAKPEAASFVMGDVNADGTFGVADVVQFQKWLLGIPGTVLANGTAADFCEDGQLDVYDLSMMKTALIKELQGTPALEDPEVQEILFGVSAPGEGSGKPTSELKIAMRCKAFCPAGKTLTVDVAKLGFHDDRMYEGDGFLYRYTIYPCENVRQIEDDRLLVNGGTGGFSKEYTGDDRLIFNRGIEYDDLSTYQHETTELDFSRYPAGSSGTIAFAFTALFYDEDGTLPEKPNTEGNGQRLYFYVGEDGVGISNTSTEDAEKSYQARGAVEVTQQTQYTGRWHGKDITRELFEALTDPDAGTIPVKFSFNYTGANDFVYQGRTLREIWEAMYGEDLTHMENLLRDGDQMKYGEALYTTGTPDGTKWTQDVYEDMLEYYGEELLSKYIVDGEFLKEQLQADLDALKAQYQAEYDAAAAAFRQARIEETVKQLDAQGIRYEQCEDSDDMLMYVTAEQFTELTLEWASLFGLARV
jgi:hypothetical protein